MFRILIVGLIFVCAQSQSSVILNRQQLLFNEPPLDTDYIADKRIVTKYVTQPVDHFNHQDNRTFQMVNKFNLFVENFITKSKPRTFSSKFIQNSHPLFLQLFRDIYKMTLTSKAVVRFSFSLAANGKLVLAISHLANIFTIWLRNPMVCWSTPNIDSMATPGHSPPFPRTTWSTWALIKRWLI